MTRLPSKTLQPVVDLATSLGFEVALTKNNHLKLTSPGGRTVIIASAIRGSRGLANAKGELRRCARQEGIALEGVSS